MDQWKKHTLFQCIFGKKKKARIYFLNHSKYFMLLNAIKFANMTFSFIYQTYF